MLERIHSNATEAWYSLLRNIMYYGKKVSPRGMDTLEVLHNNINMDMNNPIVNNDLRKLSYKFLAAEAYWILSGDNQVSGIAPYNKYISNFSDDGEIFFGAYGPRIKSQFSYVANSLVDDHMSRQAVLTIWRENPEKSKDIPCTINMTFNIRDNKLNCHTIMRSSDAWLGFPYDVFNFSMVAIMVMNMYHDMQLIRLGTGKIKEEDMKQLELGTLYWTGISSHIYFKNLDQIQDCYRSRGKVQEGTSESVPKIFFNDFEYLMTALDDTRNMKPQNIWKIRP